MAYSIAAGSVCSVTYRSTLYGQTVMNTFHYRLDSTGTLTDGGAFLLDFSGVMGGVGGLDEVYVPCLPAQCVNIFADYQWIDPVRFVKRTFVVGPVGTAGWAPVGTNQAAVLVLRADIADKRSIGPKHLPGMGGTAVSAGLIQAAAVDAMDDLGQVCRLPQTVGTRTMTPIVFGRARPAYVDKHGNTHPALPVSRREVTDYIVETTARVMRRRTVGVGI